MTSLLLKISRAKATKVVFVKVIDEVCPTFGHFSSACTKVNEIKPIFVCFPSHFSIIFLEVFEFLLNLTRNCEILQKLMKFCKANNISRNFSGIKLCFYSIAIYFVDFLVLLLVLSKDDCKILVLFEHIQNFEVSNLTMAKVKKVNIAVTEETLLGYRKSFICG